ncbi:TetR/AcrR family transcriptional regulator [Lonepinella sp. BR2357]|uniref:TetR/AcrR family transcriptional regulator n=1 Tax=Lonepinella sp. BR2357 TaxID=3434549 RepID=UPI003F6DBB6C
MTEQADLRVQRSQYYIQQALVTLLKDKSFTDISVQDILDKAMVNRSTFYRHYSGKTDLAAKMIAEFKQLLAERMEQRLESKNLNLFYLQLIPQIWDKRELILALWKIDTPKLHLYADMQQMMKGFLLVLLEQKQVDPEFMDYQSTIFAKMMLASVRYHFERNIKPDLKMALMKIREVIDIMDF